MPLVNQIQDGRLTAFRPRLLQYRCLCSRDSNPVSWYRERLAELRSSGATAGIGEVRSIRRFWIIPRSPCLLSDSSTNPPLTAKGVSYTLQSFIQCSIECLKTVFPVARMLIRFISVLWFGYTFQSHVLNPVLCILFHGSWNPIAPYPDFLQKRVNLQLSLRVSSTRVCIGLQNHFVSHPRHPGAVEQSRCPSHQFRGGVQLLPLH